MALPHTSVQHGRPPSAAELGVRTGAADPACCVTSDNWIDPPFNRWGFSHVRELTRTALVARGPQSVWNLARRNLELTEFSVEHGGRAYSYLEMLHATYTDACVVVHDGAIVFEYYDEGVRPTDTHLLMSVSKSLTASLIGVLVGQGTLTTDGLVTQYLPTLAGTVWEGCTVQHLLDMRGGVVFSEHDMDDPEADGCLLEQVSGYTTHRRRDLPANTYDWIRSLPAQGVHGGQFEYRSILIDVLAWIAEEVTGERFADLFSRLIWGRIGAECDADLIVDSAGFPVVEGGFSATARDMARFGLMHLQRGVADGRRVLPAEWVDRVVTRDQDLIDTFATSYEGDSSSPELYYHDCWWGWDAALGRYGGYGLGGQNVLIDRTSNTVIVKLSSWPKRMDPLLAKFGDAVNEALFDSLKNP